MSHRRAFRLVGPDVTRALALIGVVVLNYHGYLNGSDAAARPGSSWAHRLLDPFEGVLATRFAATFMLVAGVGVSLLTARSRASADRAAISEHRWRLARRGVLLYAGGFLLDWIWPGTILFFYGAAFVIAAVLFTLRTRWLVVVGAAAALAASAMQWWGVRRTLDGAFPDWLFRPDTLEHRSPRGLLFDTFVNGSHPLLPWLAFLCAGMVIGRALPQLAVLRVAGGALVVTALTYIVNHAATNGRADDLMAITMWSTQPYDRGLLYTLGTLGTAVTAFCLVSWVAERTRDSGVTRALQMAGQMTLSIYAAHVAVFYVVVRWMEAVNPGLGSALLFAGTFWIVAILVGSMWVRFAGMGPLERVYRRFGG
ncbi:MAG: DUF418 domain-containing protein [Ilumatobacteraceae bacterium]